MSSSSSSNPKPLNNTSAHHVLYTSSPPAAFPYGFAPNTTFVQTDPSNFQAVVQRLTGATQDPSVQKLPVVVPARRAGKPSSGHHRPAFKLHERRQTAKKLEITLNGGGGRVGLLSSPSAATRLVMGSPVSPLEMLARRSPTSPVENEEEEEERGISEKGFCFRPSPLSTPRGRSEPPELLPLFPLHSPSTLRHHSSCS